MKRTVLVKVFDTEEMNGLEASVGGALVWKLEISDIVQKDGAMRFLLAQNFKILSEKISKSPIGRIEVKP